MYKEGDLIETNIEIVYSGYWPDPPNDSFYYHIIAFDGKTHFDWNKRFRKAEINPPKVGEKYFLRAVVKSKSDQIDFEIPAYSVGAVKLLKEK